MSIKMVTAACFCTLLGGCATQHKSMYSWEGYQKNVATYLTSESGGNYGELSQSMEQDLQKIKGSNGVVPPGFHAHMGLLFVQQGRPDLFAQHLQAEKEQYPESGSFMDFLTRNFK